MATRSTGPTSKTYEFTLNEIRNEALCRPGRRPKLIVAGGIVTGVGALMFYAGAMAFLFGWYASGNGLSTQAWPVSVAERVG